MKTSWLVGLCTVFWLGISSAEAAPKTYSLKLSGPTKVGSRFKLDCSNSSKTIVTTNGAPNTTESRVEIHGIGETLAVDSNGRPSKIQFKVEQCLSDGKVLLSPEVELVAERGLDGEMKYSVGSNTLSAEKSKLLAEVLFTPSPTDLTDDEAMGTRVPQPIGGTWPPTAQASAAFTRMFGRPVQTSGSYQLVGIDKINGADCFVIKGSLKGIGKISKAGDFSFIANTKSASSLPDQKPEFGSLDLNTRASFSIEGRLVVVETNHSCKRERIESSTSVAAPP